TVNCAVAAVITGALIKLDIFGQRLGHLDFSFELFRVGDSGNNCADYKLLSGLERPFISKVLENTGNPSAHFQIVHLALFQLPLFAESIYFRGLNTQLSAG